jgi:hypothetical protein
VVITPQQEAEARERLRDAASVRRRDGEVRRRAAAVAMQARRPFVAGDHQGALATLHAFSPQELVAPVIAELETELRRLKRRRDDTPHPTPGSAPSYPPPTPVPAVPVDVEPAPNVIAPEPSNVQAEELDETADMPVPYSLETGLPVWLNWTNVSLVVVLLAIAISAIAYAC